MRIRYLSLTNFRNYSRLELALPDRSLLLFGANAQGKTSLLEAIHVLATGTSPFASVDRQMVRWGAADEALPYARVWAEVERQSATFEIEIIIEQLKLANGSDRTQKTVRIDRTRRRQADLAGRLNAVLFAPQDIDIVAGPPSRRRAYMDVTRSQVDATYAQSLARYEELRRQRNAALKHLRDAGGDRSQLTPFEEGLARAGSLILVRRNSLVRELSERAGAIQRELTGQLEWLRLVYEPNVAPEPAAESVDALHAYRDGQSNALGGASMADMERALRSALRTRRREEIARGITLVGPHRDDLRFIGGSPDQGTHAVDLGVFGSRGQQRTAVLSLKLAELAWMKDCTKESPVLLFDEVLAELDRRRRDLLLSQVCDVEQALLTGTDPEMFSADFRARAAVWEVRAGVVGRPEEAA